jgi:hypothetical protein
VAKRAIQKEIAGGNALTCRKRSQARQRLLYESAYKRSPDRSQDVAESDRQRRRLLVPAVRSSRVPVPSVGDSFHHCVSGSVNMRVAPAAAAANRLPTVRYVTKIRPCPVTSVEKSAGPVCCGEAYAVTVPVIVKLVVKV